MLPVNSIAPMQMVEAVLHDQNHVKQMVSCQMEHCSPTECTCHVKLGNISDIEKCYSVTRQQLRTRICMYVCVHIIKHACMHTCIHAYIHAYMHDKYSGLTYPFIYLQYPKQPCGRGDGHC